MDNMEVIDEELLTSLGVNFVDKDVFEQNFLDKLEEQYKNNERSETETDSSHIPINITPQDQLEDGELSNHDNSNEIVDIDEGEDGGMGMEETTDMNVSSFGQTSTFISGVGINESNPGTSSTTKISQNEKFDPNSGGSSMLKSLLLASRPRNREKPETETEKQVRKGEMTPFGNVIEKCAPKKDSFLEFSRYMQNQVTLNKNFQKKRNLDTTKQQKNKKIQSDSDSEDEHENKNKTKITDEIDSDDDNDDGLREKQIQKHKQTVGRGAHSHSKKKKNSLDMNILFPKKRRKKVIVGTETSDDPRDARRRPGKSRAETTGIYINESEDSDFIPPSDSDYSEDGMKPSGSVSKKFKTTRVTTNKRKRVTDYKECNTSDSFEDSDVDRPVKKRKKLADDGDIKSYKQRVENWKNNEIRFTGEMHKLDGDFKIPIHLWESLYNYQKVGVKWLWELHQQRSGGILGDEMGLGKTIQVIVFLAGVSCTNLLFRFSPYRGLGPSLIICPATVMHQWVKEFHTWWPPFRVAILHDSGSYGGTKLNLIRSIHEVKGILVTTYAGLVNSQDEILKHKWHYVIIDEGHKIRNPDAKLTLAVKQISTPHRLILSGSPLQNNLKELWSLFDFIFPGKLGTLPVFMEQFAVPITQGGYANASDVQVAAAFKCATTLRTIISPYLLRRMKSDVSTHLNLPSKSEQVLFCKLTDEQRESYVNYLKSDQVNAIITGRYEIFVGLIYLRKICNHPHLYDGGPKIYKNIETSTNNNNKYNNILNRVPKNKSNKNKSDTIAKLLEEDEEGIDIDIDPSSSFGHWSKSGKMIVVRTLLKLWKQQGHKVLLFTQSRQMLCILENFIRSEKYSYLRLDGSTSIGSRQPMIDKYNEDPDIFIFILTTRVGGLGINLTGGNRVIIFDPDWNPSTDLQARERAWRIGQNRQVTIYRLITSGTIEEKIYHRQIFKQFLTNRVLKNPKQKRFFKSNDMLELFTLNETNNEGGGTESQAIFAGTGSNIKIPKRQKPMERKSGKFRRVPYLLKQSTCTPNHPDDDENGQQQQHDLSTSTDVLQQNKQQQSTSSKSTTIDSTITTNSLKQDDYVLRKLFKKSGVEAALRHDRIVDTNESDYLLIEKEAERVATDAVNALKRSREQCWSAVSGNITWTGHSGSMRPPPQIKKPKFDFNKNFKKKISIVKPPPPPTSPIEPEPLETSFFTKPKLKENSKQILSSSELLAIIRQRKRPLIVPKTTTTTTTITTTTENIEDPTEELGEGPSTTSTSNEINESSSSTSNNNNIYPVEDKHMELLREIHEFISFRAMVDGQASTDEILLEFKNKLPPKDSPLFKQMLNQLCTHRQVEGRRIWRLKPEFR